MKRIANDVALFSFGYAAYSLIELAWRRYTHFTMGIAGGLCFLILFRLYKKRHHLSLIKKCLIGSGVITGIEFVFGCVLNIALKLNIWDYSSLPLNIFGQICPLFSLLWAFLSLPIIFIADKLGKKPA